MKNLLNERSHKLFKKLFEDQGIDSTKYEEYSMGEKLNKEERVTESEWGRGAGEYDASMGRNKETPYPVGKTPLPDEGYGEHPLLGAGLSSVNLFGIDDEEHRQKARAVRIQRGIDAGCPEGMEKSRGSGGCGEVPSADYLGGTHEEYEIYAKYGAPFEGKYDSIEITSPAVAAITKGNRDPS